MASSYALPASALSQHHHGSDHACSHSHSPSHSHSHASSGNSLSPTRSRKDLRLNGAHSHNRSHQHDSNQSQYRANSNLAMQINVPPLSSSSHWKTESTLGGKKVMTPTAASFDAAGVYEPPVASRARSHSHSHHHHDHSAERSRFTSMLLPYTARWPILHAVVTDKDSRRIFYFMRLVGTPSCDTY